MSMSYLRPERNCDHYKTVEEAVKAYWAFCEAHYHDSCKGCPFTGKGGCLANFLYAEYKPEVKK